MSHALGPRLEHQAEAALRPLYKAHYRFQFLSAAFRAGLFTVLASSPGLTRSEIAKRLEMEEQPTRILLLGCTVAGLVAKDGEGYFNTAISEPLAADVTDLPGAFVPFEQQLTYRAMGWFYEALKANTNVGLDKELPGEASTMYGRLVDHPELETTFHHMMGGVSRSVAEDLARKLDLSQTRHLLDVGGGTAVNATALARRWPHLEITIVDLPTVVEAANARIAEAGLGDRVRAVGLDVFNDELPAGCDGVIFAHFLEIWSVDRNRMLLAKAARAMKPGTKVFVLTPFQEDDETGPELAAYLSAYFQTLASGEGMVYTAKEYEQWLAEVGFEPSGRFYVGGLSDVLISGVRQDVS
ncbi:Demethylspheroidene O-methyltransferase [Streptomyces violarus]|uniref:Ubiquinone/menaquinone biosynthesis C-methylase UbiE n=1 Tax=Streptomyces violarus TaxID=67380 RepID=A0A7W5F2Y0_9ACTN|nr:MULTISPECIES: methyltransferase [Streptomyces]MBB3078090.1 ubiquinone/menaquinone biosynthesis C-methylase UbiE [Streptomyces violarus]WRT99753.1 methyltransferase [Streptomyces sp. CGMCC 4.1772]GHD19638.1 Demethylspheroidene O-methyltransferase [Streptomyces violarus]